MPSPFPGFDPFIETQEWEDFHTRFNAVIADSLAPRIEPSYVVRIERRVYVEHCELPMPAERRETYLVIRERESMQVVTVIDTLSPANKRAGGDGRREYLEKREQILESDSHLVELDLLRGGQRLPTTRSLPPGDYYALVSRAKRRPKAVVYPWPLRAALPPIPIPLKPPDADVTLDLQACFTTVFDRARYDLSLNYQQPLAPPLSDVDAQWMGELIQSR